MLFIVLCLSRVIYTPLILCVLSIKVVDVTEEAPDGQVEQAIEKRHKTRLQKQMKQQLKMRVKQVKLK